VAYRLNRATWTGIALLAAVVPWFFVVRTLQSAQPVKIPTKPQESLVWGDRVFSSPADMGRWLRSRGASYRTWLAAHPSGAAVLAHKPPPAAAAPMKPPPTVADAPKRRARATAAASSSRGISNGSNSPDPLWEVASFLIAGLAVAFVAFATAPRRLLALIRPEWEDISVDTRIAVFATALSIGVGALLAHVGG
jgi:hypothetical protein